MFVVKEFIGGVVCVLFVALFVYLLNNISAPDANPGPFNFLAIAGLVLLFVLLMLAWEPLVHGTGSFPYRVPSSIGIPLGVAAFVVACVSGLGEVLLHANEVLSPLIALAVAGCILGGATYLSIRPDPKPRAGSPGVSHQPSAATHHPSATVK